MLGVIQRSLFLIAITCILFIAFKYKYSLYTLFQNTNLALFFLSLVLGFLSNLVLMRVFINEIKLENKNTDSWLLFRIYFIGQITKYIPGKIWSIIYQSSSLGGLSSTKIVIKANYFLTVFSIVGSLALSGVLFLYLGSNVQGLVLIISAFLLFVFLNPIIHWVLNKFCNNKYIAILANNFNNQYPLEKQIMYLFLFVTLNGLTFTIFFSSIGFELSVSLNYIATYTLAWVAGVVTIIFPTGVGVREFVFIFLNEAGLDDELVQVTFSIAIYLRIWQLTQDIFNLLLSHVIIFLGR